MVAGWLMGLKVVLDMHGCQCHSHELYMYMCTKLGGCMTLIGVHLHIHL